MRNICLCFLTEFEFKIMALNRRKCPEKAAVACYREENYAKGCREENYAKRNTWNEIFKDNSLHINYHSQEYRSLNQFSADEFDALRKKKFHLRYVGEATRTILPATLYYKYWCLCTSIILMNLTYTYCERNSFFFQKHHGYFYILDIDRLPPPLPSNLT